MKTCPNCRNQAEDDILSCPICGTTLDVLTPPPVDYFDRKEPVSMPELIPADPRPDPHDHTKNYEAADIQENKLLCMCVYLLDVLGIIVALLMSPGSAYTRFHIRQALKITVIESIAVLASLLLCWTFIVPILGVVAIFITLFVKLICFADVCCGKAKDAPIIRYFRF